MWLLSRVSLPHFRRHAVRTALTVFGIVLGIAAIMATTFVTDAVFQTFRHAVHATAGRADLQVTNGRAGVPESLSGAIGRLPGVMAVSPLVEGFVSLESGNGELLAIFGVALLEDTEREVQLPRSAVEIPDTVEFVARTDSVAVTRSFARTRRLEFGSRFVVMTPRGRRTLTVRGFVDDMGPASLFEGMVALMDLPAAQRLLGREDLVDRIDVRLASGAPRPAMANEIERHTGGRARVVTTEAHGGEAERLLFSVRVMLGIGALVSFVVGFLLIYHTVSVSILQRRRDIASLDAVGVGAETIALWLATEAVCLGLLAGAGGYAVGWLLARISIASVGTVATAFVRIPPADVSVSSRGVFLSTVLGVSTTLAATLLPAWSLLRRPTSRFLGLAPDPAPSRPGRNLAAAVVGLLGVGALLHFAPLTLPYRPLVGYIFGLNSLTLVSFALLCPLTALAVARIAARMADRSRRLGLLLASRAIGREPSGATAVVVAIVIGLGWVLADASLIESFRTSWIRWLDHQYRSDLILSGGAATVSFLTAPSVAEHVVAEARRIDGVREVQGVRITQIDYRGRPIAIQAFDRATAHLPVRQGDWKAVAEAFWSGNGVLLNEQLAHLERLGPGDDITIATGRGTRTFPILATFTDFRVGYLGSIAMSRALYRKLWPDRLVNAVHVWLDGPGHAARVRAELHRRLSDAYGVHALTLREYRTAVLALMDHIFALHYVLATIAIFVSMAGVANFLLTRSMERQPEYRVLEATGVDVRDIRSAIVAEGLLLGLVGASLGLLAGSAVSAIIVRHSVPMVNGWHFDFRFPVATAFRIAALAVFLSGGAGLIPAWLATRRFAALREVAE